MERPKEPFTIFLWWPVLTALLGCGPTNYWVPNIQIGPGGVVSPVGTRSVLQPATASYYFFHGAHLIMINHFENEPEGSKLQRTFYMETKPDGKLDRTVKSDVLLAGEFGLVSATRKCFYNRPVESNYSSVGVELNDNANLQAFEKPIVLPAAPAKIPPLTSISIVRAPEHSAKFTLISADYEINGERRNLQTFKANSGKGSAGDTSYHTATQFGIPSTLNMKKFELTHRVDFSDETPSASWLIQFYDFGKLIQIQELRGGVPISFHWLKPSVTLEEQTIGPECDSRLRQQQTMGLPTTGY